MSTLREEPVVPQNLSVRRDALEGMRLLGGRELVGSARVLENEQAGSDVPEFDAQFEVGIVPATRDVADVQRGCAHDPNLPGSPAQTREVEISVGDGLGAFEQADRDATVTEI